MASTIVLVLNLVLFARAHSDFYTCEFSKPGETVELKCPQGEVIYNLTLTSKNTERNCYGKQNTVLVAGLKCYWQNSCNVTLAKHEIITYITDDSHMSCIGKIPDVLLYNFSCIANSLVIQSMHNTSSTVTASMGIIKSHSKYPWHYKGPLETRELKGMVELLRPPGDKVLYLKYINYDVATGDTVNISDGTEDWKDGLKVLHAQGKFKKVTVSFTIKPGTKFSGFLICFKWLKATSEADEWDFESMICNTDNSKTPAACELDSVCEKAKTIEKPTTQRNINKKPNGVLIGPTKLTIKKPRRIKVGCKKVKFRYLRIGVINLPSNAHFSYSSRKKDFEGYINCKKTFQTAKLKKLKIEVPAFAKLCFVWEEKNNKKPLNCEEIIEEPTKVPAENCPEVELNSGKKKRKKKRKRNKN